MNPYLYIKHYLKNLNFLAKKGELPLVNINSVIKTKSTNLIFEPSQKIPKVIYTTWMRHTVPRSIARQWRRIAELNPEYKIIFYDDRDVDAFMQEEWGDHPIINTYYAATFPQIRADIWRYCILYSRGGVYLDFKSNINTPLGKVIHPNDVVILGREANLIPDLQLRAQLLELPSGLRTEQWVLNWLLCSATRQDLFKLMIDRIVRLTPQMMGVSFTSPKQEILDFTGPIGLTKAYLSYIKSSENYPSSIRLSGVDFDGQADYILPHGRMLEYTRMKPSQHYSMAHERPILALK